LVAVPIIRSITTQQGYLLVEGQPTIVVRAQAYPTYGFTTKKTKPKTKKNFFIANESLLRVWTAL